MIITISISITFFIISFIFGKMGNKFSYEYDKYSIISIVCVIIGGIAFIRFVILACIEWI